MLILENVVQRWREWRDRQEEEPDLVPRMRKLWTAPAAPPPPDAAHRRTAVLRPQPALTPRG